MSCVLNGPTQVIGGQLTTRRMGAVAGDRFRTLAQREPAEISEADRRGNHIHIMFPMSKWVTIRTTRESAPILAWNFVTKMAR